MVLKELNSNFKVIFNYLKSDIIKKQRAFKIGLFTIFLVVFFISLLMNTISVSPVIFLRLSEDQAGETDIIMLPFFNKEDASKRPSAFDELLFDEKRNRSGTINIPGISSGFQLQFLNFTDLHEKLKDEPYLQGLTPRWILMSNSTSRNKQGETFWAMTNLLIINSKLENKYGLGRKLQLRELNSFECYVSESLYKNLKLDPKFSHNTIILQIKVSSLLKAFGGFENLLKGDNPEAKNEEYKINDKRRPKDFNNSKFILDLFSPIDEENITMSNQTKNDNLTESSVIKRFFLNYKGLSDYKINFNMSEILQFLELSNLLEDDEIILSGLFDSDFTKNIPFVKSLKNIIDLAFNKPQDEQTNEITKIQSEILRAIFTYDNETKSLKVRENNTSININFSNLLLSIPEENLDDLFTLRLNLTVKEIIKSNAGKWPSVLGNVIALDSSHAKDSLEETLINTAENIVHKMFNSTIFDKYIEDKMKGFLSGFNIESYALTVNAVLKDKFDAYSGDNPRQRKGLSKLTGKIIEKLGHDYPVKMQLPLYESFKALQIVKIFLENIFSSVMFFLWILCIMLIYSLMLGNVDERTYEFGMLRALGYKKSNLISMILMQALIFSIPAIILALFACYIINILISYLVYTYSGLEAAYNLSTSTIIWSVVAGLSIPLVSSYFPIQKALSENLKEALTIFNKKIGDISVSIVRLEQLGISPASLLSSCILIIMGFATYYLCPLSFFLMDYSIFLFIMNMILIVMIVGLIFMLQLLVPKLQTIVLDVIMFFIYRDRNIKFVVQKNLVGHSRRNQKTSIMFMIALSFIIFSGCTLRLVANFIESASKNFFGANVWVYQEDKEDSIDQNKLNDYLEEFKKKFPNTIKNYSYISYPLDEIIDHRIGFSSLCGFPDKNVDLISVDPNLLYSGFSELYMYSEYDKTLNYTIDKDTNTIDIISGLYLNENLPPILDQKNKSIVYPVYPLDKDKQKREAKNILLIIPEGIRNMYSVDTKNHANILIKKPSPENYPAKVVGLGIKIPGIPSFSSYSTIANFSPLLISTNQMKDLIDNQMKKHSSVYEKLTALPAYKNTPDNIRKKVLMIKFYDEVPSKIREVVFFGVKNFVNSDNTQTVFVDELIDSAKNAADIMEYFFLFIGLIALILSFFLIWTSFYCNIKDNICEYGIMRAVGISKKQAMRVFLYEASALILSSIILGTFIGIVISTTLVLQFNLFSELPFKPNFPLQLYLIMCVTGFVLGLLGSYYPTHQVNKLSLVKILKGIFD